MKKTVAAVAVLGAFAGSALAADVTLYGVVDAGLVYTHLDQDAQGVDATDKFEMKSGNQAGSRWGLKGVEDLGNGVQVGFILESGFNVDDGSFRTADTLFDREASLFVQGSFGKVAFGKLGSIVQGASSWGKVGSVSAFGTSFGNYAAQAGAIFATSTVYDNMIAYSTPSFGGVTVYAQYSMGKSQSQSWDADNAKWKPTMVENESSTDRYYAIGAEYANGPAKLFFAVDSTNYASWTPVDPSDPAKPGYSAKDTDDSLTVTLGGNYDFNVAKLYAGVQYFDEVAGKWIGASANQPGKGKVKGWAATVSASAPVAGGNAMLGVGYTDASAADSVTDNGNSARDFDLSRWVVSAGYTYNLSKRTNLYGVASYMQDKLEPSAAGAEDVKPTATTVMVGLRHRF